MRLEFLLEEASAERMLSVILPKLLPQEVEFHLHPHSGRTHLLQQLTPKLSAYSRWLGEDDWVVVVCDRHRSDCQDLKQSIMNSACSANFRRVLVRIVVPELESWFIGDLDAIERAFPRTKASSLKRKARYLKPDSIPSPAHAIDLLLKRKGYPAGYPKVSGAEMIAPEMNPGSNSSHSFNVFLRGIERITSQQ